MDMETGISTFKEKQVTDTHTTGTTPYYIMQNLHLGSGTVRGCCNVVRDDDKFTPTKHLTPPPHHSSRPAAAHTDTETRG